MLVQYIYIYMYVTDIFLDNGERLSRFYVSAK